ncbi:MAG: hypothetical protein IPN94_10730 [Sphingobacteriales bacterium]|nr:hypothetical protein [Sphingobacteriales bacterium]
MLFNVALYSQACPAVCDIWQSEKVIDSFDVPTYISANIGYNWNAPTAVVLSTDYITQYEGNVQNYLYYAGTSLAKWFPAITRNT